MAVFPPVWLFAIAAKKRREAAEKAAAEGRPVPDRMGVRKYLRKAFLAPYNMLFFLAGLGAAAALAVTPALSSVSAGLRGDPLTYAVIAALLLVVALAASLVPALRVAGVNPAAALRHE